MTATTLKLVRVGKVIIVGHYSNLHHVLVCDGKRFSVSYRGDEEINGKTMAKFNVLGVTIYTARVDLASAVAWKENT